MARPKYGRGDVRAREKLIDAFWELLEAEPYTQMSVREVCRESGLNKNTFYYHFEGLDALADEAVGDALPIELAQSLVSAPVGKLPSLQPIAGTPVVRGKFAHVGLVLAGNGAALQGTLMSHFTEQLAGMVPCSSEEERRSKTLLLGFVAGGLVNTLRGKKPAEYADAVTELQQLPAIRTCMDELRS